MLLKIFAIALPVFFAIDMFWLGVLAKNLYREQLGLLMRPDINWLSAITFYLIFIAGLVFFVIAPAIEKGSWVQALMYGAFFGFVCYATYDLTNLAIVKNWPFLITIVDLAWGAVLAATVSTVTYFIVTKLGV